MIAPVVQADIKIGEHVQRQFLGMTFNMDTIWALLVAGVLVTLLGFWARQQLTKDTEDHVPTKLQLVGEIARELGWALWLRTGVLIASDVPLRAI